MKKAINTREVLALKREVMPVLSDFRGMEIKTDKDMLKATEALSIINKHKDAIDEKEKFLTRPFREGIKNIQDLFSPIKNDIEIVVKKIKGEMTDFYQDKKKEQAKIALEVSKGNIGLEDATKALEEVQIHKKIETPAGRIVFKDMTELKVLRLHDIPREYLVPNEKKILEHLRKGISVKGCKLLIVPTPYNYRNNSKEE